MSEDRKAISGLYAVTPELADTESLLWMVSQAISGGARLFQYRNKSADRDCMLEQATALRKLTGEAGAQLIINDDFELALRVSADGVHLGRGDFAGQPVPGLISAIRQQALASGIPSFIVGISCYDQLERAIAAENAGANYVAFGSFYPSATKPDAVRANPALIVKAKRQLSLPIVAIGGITVQNAPELIAAGADALAVVTALFNSEDIQSRASAFIALYANHV